ncbi:protocadherin gamma-A6-like [Lissotriton helveticus]
MARAPKNCYSGAQSPRRCYSGAQSSRRCYSGAHATRRCDSGARSLRRCDSGARSSRRCHPGAPLLLLVALLTVCGAASGQLRYSIPEEMRKGSFVGNVALDLGMDTKELSEGGARIVSRGRKQYFVLNVNNGHLYINERIDREEVCEQQAQCLFDLEIIVQREMKVYAVEIEILDINDHSPNFLTDKIVLQINENKSPGARFVLPDAHDPDVGENSLQSYELSPNNHFALNFSISTNVVKYAELVLKNHLDREKQDIHDLIFTATDGGDPVRSSTVQVRVIVLDANDNSPVFNQSVYKTKTLENVAKGTVVATVTATDRDQGANSELTYSFNNIAEKVLHTFHLDSKTGEISTVKPLDFEETEQYELEVQATDGERAARCKVLVEVINVNDNGPEIIVSSVLNQVVENSPVGTVIALLEVYDRDSEEYGEITCHIPPHLPFQLEKSYGSYYSLKTEGPLDREEVSEYNITVTATDKGSPPISKTKTIHLQVTDENANPPLFDQLLYRVYVMENMQPGSSIFRVRATDKDVDINGKVSYSIGRGLLGEHPVTSFISINSETGIIYALRVFDFEEFREFDVQIKAQDRGSPTLVNNATLAFFILDQNDNTPEILYPSPPTDGSSGVEMAPRSSEPGYLITKVVAVDEDSGQNAWLSYQLLRSTDQGLFTVNAHTGEIKTVRPIMEKDAMKQLLVILVKDNGQPSLSSSVTVTILLADSIPEVVPDLGTLSSPTDMESNLTLYLVIAVSVVSFLFLFFVILLLLFRLRQWRQSQLLTSSGVNFNAIPSSQLLGIDGVRAFLQTYSHDVCLTTDSLNSQNTFPCVSHYVHTPVNKGASEKQGAVMVEDLLNVGKDDQNLIQSDYATAACCTCSSGDLELDCQLLLGVYIDSLVHDAASLESDVRAERANGEMLLCEMRGVAGHDTFGNDAAGFEDDPSQQGESMEFHQDGGDLIIFIQALDESVVTMT